MELIEPALVAAFAAVAAASSSCCARLAIVFVSSFACYVLLPPHTARFTVHWVRSQYFGDAFNSEFAEILLWLEVKGQTING